MSDNIALELIKAAVTIVGAVISGVVAVMIVKVRRDVKETRKVVASLPALVTDEHKATRAAVARASSSSSAGAPDPGAIHTHRRNADQ